MYLIIDFLQFPYPSPSLVAHKYNTSKKSLRIILWKKSIIKYIYEDSRPLFYTNKGFKPIYNILDNGNFEQAINESTILTVNKNYGKYIQEKNERLDVYSIVYKINYLNLNSN